ncbi:DUF3791 domain-containing protein [Clostridium gasigenes]|nr:DUF3791 domain-containing protein [Clostridium gasigenes]MBU3087144.1 DUF3791 domain-containing protein [Clostridium gasigenes]MBU3136419.1 DUF3791 domain-containing protein [Clostridium gasigenes]
MNITFMILDSYIIECYDGLHTLGSRCFMENIIEISKEQGAKLS